MSASIPYRNSTTHTIDGDSVLGAHACHVPRHSVPHGFVDRLQLQLGLLRRQTPEEEVDVRRRECARVKVLAQSSFRRLGRLWYGLQTCEHRPTRADHVRPVELAKAALCTGVSPMRRYERGRRAPVKILKLLMNSAMSTLMHGSPLDRRCSLRTGMTCCASATSSPPRAYVVRTAAGAANTSTSPTCGFASRACERSEAHSRRSAVSSAIAGASTPSSASASAPAGSATTRARNASASGVCSFVIGRVLLRISAQRVCEMRWRANSWYFIRVASRQTRRSVFGKARLFSWITLLVTA
jgi:hypothetical protein